MSFEPAAVAPADLTGDLLWLVFQGSRILEDGSHDSDDRVTLACWTLQRLSDGPAGR